MQLQSFLHQTDERMGPNALRKRQGLGINAPVMLESRRGLAMTCPALMVSQEHVGAGSEEWHRRR